VKSACWCPGAAAKTVAWHCAKFRRHPRSTWRPCLRRSRAISIELACMASDAACSKGRRLALKFRFDKFLSRREQGTRNTRREWVRSLPTYHDRGIDTVVFGDLFLEEIRAYRERLPAKHKMVGTYPVWGRDTSQLIREFMASGLKAVVSASIQQSSIPRSSAGISMMTFSPGFLRMLIPADKMASFKRLFSMVRL
jgi:diphthamide synthase (EF-2-diphthine--ammonia ligase)